MIERCGRCRGTKIERCRCELVAAADLPAFCETRRCLPKWLSSLRPLECGDWSGAWLALQLAFTASCTAVQARRDAYLERQRLERVESLEVPFKDQRCRQPARGMLIGLPRQRCAKSMKKKRGRAHALEATHLPQKRLVCRRAPLLDSVEHMREEMAKDMRLLLSEINMHSQAHTFTCFKTRRGRRRCRFGFPHALVPATYIAEDGRIKRQRDDPFLNCYNPYFAFALRCNHDIRLIRSGPDARSAMIYICDYISKPSIKLENMSILYRTGFQRVKLMEEAKGPLDDVTRARELVKRCLTQLAGGVERSGPEVCQFLLGLPSEYSSHKFCYVYLGQFLRWLAHTEQLKASLPTDALEVDSDGEEEPPEEVPDSDDENFVVDDISDRCDDVLLKKSSFLLLFFRRVDAKGVGLDRSTLSEVQRLSASSAAPRWVSCCLLCLFAVT